MKKIHINQVKDHIGKQVTITGFVQVFRDQKNIKFLLIRDISGVIQVVITKDNQEAFTNSSGLSLESVVQISGLAKEEKQAPGGFEIAGEGIVVLSLSNPEPPIPVVAK